MMKFHLNKTYSDSDFALDVTFELHQGDFLTIYGQSGAGKTSILRLIAGLDTMQTGKITNNSTIWFDQSQRINLTPQQRSIGFVFQDNSLFPHMTVLENLKFALKKGDSPTLITELISSFDINDLIHRKVTTLSGGQKQKVALARAIVQKPSVLLLDEPLSAVDHLSRTLIQDLILKVHQEYNLTTILVTHHLPELFKLSNKVLKIKAGKIEKFGTPKEIFTSITNPNQFTLIGTILNLEHKDGQYTIIIQLHTNSIKQIVTKSEFDQYTIGGLIEVSVFKFQTSIQKLKTT